MTAASNNSGSRAAIVLGAGKFKKYPSLNRAGFSSSAADFIAYLLDAELFALSDENLLNLFDSDLSPGDQLGGICDFLDARLTHGVRSNDLIFYYVGHGGFVGINREYFLAIANTREGLEGSTGIRIGDLSSTLREHARGARKYLILDCCFAASAFVEFQHSSISK